MEAKKTKIIQGVGGCVLIAGFVTFLVANSKKNKYKNDSAHYKEWSMWDNIAIISLISAGAGFVTFGATGGYKDDPILGGTVGKMFEGE